MFARNSLAENSQKPGCDSSDHAGRYSTPACAAAFVRILTNAHSSLITPLATAALGPRSPISAAKIVALCMTTTCCLPLSPPSILARAACLRRLFDSVGVGLGARSNGSPDETSCACRRWGYLPARPFPHPLDFSSHLLLRSS